MQVITDPSDFPQPNGRRVLVPSLGNLHLGHLSLVEAAKRIGDEIVVSIFVNPTQFRAGEDYERYPRTPERDLEMCLDAKVDYVFMPARETMYPAGESAVTIHVDKVGDNWEGELRPGHFDGVATVVANLLLCVRPQDTVFGQKDLQQNAVIRRLLQGLRLDVRVHIMPTIRENDGLALSSRNAYLRDSERLIAPQLYQGLINARDAILNSKNPELEAILASLAQQIDSRFALQYVALVNQNSMARTSTDDRDSALILAAKIGETRLIDNLPIYT